MKISLILRIILAKAFINYRTENDYITKGSPENLKIISAFCY